jgi:hypothetical protein
MGETRGALDYDFIQEKENKAQRFRSIHSAYDALVTWSQITQQPIPNGTEFFAFHARYGTRLLHRYGSK